MEKISLIIPTLNAQDDLPALLNSLRNQTLQPDEVLIVDSSSDDHTAEIAATFGCDDVHTITRSSFNHGQTRHDAFLRSSGDIVVFMTQDAVLADKQSLERLIAAMSDQSIALVTGRQLPKDDARRFEQLVRAYNYPEASNVRNADDIARLGIKAFFASDVFAAYRRSSYLECGGFPRPVNTNEDMLMAARFLKAGYSVAYASEACVMHSHNLTPAQQYRRNRAVGLCLVAHSDELEGVSEVGEGMSLVKKVSAQLIKEGRLMEFCAFGVDCAARLLGNRSGRAAGKKERTAQ